MRPSDCLQTQRGPDRAVSIFPTLLNEIVCKPGMEITAYDRGAQSVPITLTLLFHLCEQSLIRPKCIMRRYVWRMSM